MSLSYTIEPLPAVWPGTSTPRWQRSRAPFKTMWSRVLHALEREVGMLRGRNVRIAIDVEPRYIRQDGQLRADARPRSPAIIVSFDTPQGRLAFPADRFAYWEQNVDAVARVLEDLRRAERYGVKQGAQYTGFKALPATTTAALSTEQAAAFVARHAAPIPAEEVLRDRVVAQHAMRVAATRLHPDAGGTTEDFMRLQEAKRVLAAHHGGTL